jgi:DNA-binding response OmpR family regulator
MRILLVEDEDGIASFVVKGLAAEGHSVDRAATVAEGKRLAAEREYDLALLDLMLPDGHGRDVLAVIRETRPEMPVIIVSALSDVGDKVELLDLGADDYLAKPFALEELSARIRANARQHQENARVLTAGGISLDTKTRVARRGERVAELPGKEFQLLEYFLRNAGQVLSREQLLDGVWDIDFETASNVVDVYVGYLRRKLDEPGKPSVIETVRGAGYRVRVA